MCAWRLPRPGRGIPRLPGSPLALSFEGSSASLPSSKRATFKAFNVLTSQSFRHRDKNALTATALESAFTDRDARKSFSTLRLRAVAARGIRFYKNCRGHLLQTESLFLLLSSGGVLALQPSLFFPLWNSTLNVQPANAFSASRTPRRDLPTFIHPGIAPLFSITCELPNLQVLCFDIHANWWGVYTPSALETFNVQTFQRANAPYLSLLFPGTCKCPICNLFVFKSLQTARGVYPPISKLATHHSPLSHCRNQHLSRGCASDVLLEPPNRSGKLAAGQNPVSCVS
jgi:hypothetical protein